MRRRLLATAAALVMALALGTAASADNGGTPFSITLLGTNEVPLAAHAADTGSVQLTLNQGQGEVCWTFGEITLAAGETLPTAGHIHEAPVGEPGPVVVPLFGTATTPAPTAYPTDTVCVEADRDLIKDIRQNPENYYVNLHNATHPGGVMRGQLR